MALLEETDVFHRYRYKLREFFILYEDESVQVPNERLTSLTIINDYMVNLFPIMRITINLDASTYYKIIKNKKTVKFKIRLQSYYMENNTEKVVSLYEDYINKTFSLILDDEDEDMNFEVREKAYGKNESENLNAVRNNIEFFLFDSELMKSSRKTVNAIPENSTVTNAISYICSELNIRDLLMTRADNTTIYDTIIIPPLKISKAFAYIDSFYGIHDKGSIIYFGVDGNYLLKFHGECSAYRPNEKKETTIIVPKVDTLLSNNVCVLKKSSQPETVFNICDYNTIKFFDETVSQDILTGKNVRVVDAYTGEIEETLKDGEDGRMTIIVNRGENKYLKDIYLAQMLSGETVITVDLQDIDLYSLTPNKKFKFIFEDTNLSRKYKGNYLIAKSTISFIRDANDFKPMISCVFRKS